MAPQRKKIQFQSAEISAVTKNALVKPISAQTVNLFSTLGPIFEKNRLSDVDVQLSDIANKTYSKFCEEVGKLSLQLSDSLTDAMELCEYNGKANEAFFDLEKSIFSATVPLIMKRKKTSGVNYLLYGAYSKEYPQSEVYTTDDMVYTSKLKKKRLNFKPSMALGECYKILNEISLNKENNYTSYASLNPSTLNEAKTAFIDHDIVENGAECYRVIADNYLVVCFKIDITVPYFISDDQEIRYQTLDLDNSKDDYLYSRFSDGSEIIKKRGPDGNYIQVEALKRFYRKLLKERFNRIKKRSNSMFEARNADFENLSEEYAIFETIFVKTKEIIDNLQSGKILLSDVDKNLRDIADSLAQLNILVNVAKEFYGNVDSFSMESDYYIRKYDDGINKTMKRAYLRAKVPSVKFNIDLDSDKTPITFSSSGDFDEPLDERTLKFIVSRSGKQSSDIDKLTVDVGRENTPRATTRFENGNAVFSVFSRSYDKNAYDAERAKMFRVPGKIIGLCKLIISQDGFEIVGQSGSDN